MRVLRWWSKEVVCEQAVALFTDYLEGALSPRRRAALERHLAACPHCARYLAQMRLTIDLVGRVEPEQIGEEAMAELVGVFLALSEEEAEGSS